MPRVMCCTRVVYCYYKSWLIRNTLSAGRAFDFIDRKDIRNNDKDLSVVSGLVMLIVNSNEQRLTEETIQLYLVVYT